MRAAARSCENRGAVCWSLAEPEHFWSELARFADVRAQWGAGPVIEDAGRMPGARFFPAPG